MINFRNEAESDYPRVEEITRKAFYNVYVPGCVEHYLVHVMRTHEDFIPELDFVIELDGQVIGNVMYAKATLIDDTGTKKEILTFGPVSIAPKYQRQGYGKLLLEQMIPSLFVPPADLYQKAANLEHVGDTHINRVKK